jgi:outer membrane protein assembly factor BamB
VWKKKLEYLPTHGNGGSPALANDLLIICCDGHDVQYVVGIEKQTGNLRWKTRRETLSEKGFSFGTPLVLEINGRNQAICPGSDAVYSYDPATGKEIWHVDYPGGYSVIPRPVYGNGLVYICTGYNKPKLLAIDPTGAGDVTETHVRWTIEKQVPHTPSPLLVGRNLFFVSDKGIAHCVDALTGESHWQERLGGNYSASPLEAGGRVYFQDENGTGIVVAATAEFQELARNHLPEEERTFASYAIDDDALFLRSEKHLYRIEE